MAFAKNTNSNVSSFASRGKSREESWKADAFLNFYLPTKNGRRKVGYIPLKASKALEAYILERLGDADEATMAAFKEALVIEVSSAEADEDNLPLF